MFLLRLKLESSTSLQEVASYFVFCFSLCVPLPLFIRSSPLRGERMWGGGGNSPRTSLKREWGWPRQAWPAVFAQSRRQREAGPGVLVYPA